MALTEVKDATFKPLKIVIIGGSLAGLITGFLLKKKGHVVTILEQAPSSEREGLQAGVGFQGVVRKFFEEELGLKGSSIGVESTEAHLVNFDLKTRFRFQIPLLLTTWETAYYNLRASFDGFASSYVPNPSPFGHTGTGRYQVGKKTIGVDRADDQMIVVVENTETGAEERFAGDIIIAADGANSTIRRQLEPDFARESSGYVIWRGVVPLRDVDPDVVERLKEKIVIYSGKYHYCIVYTIPGNTGKVTGNDRNFNFIWYFWPEKPSMGEIMTDVDGHRHQTSVPKGKLQPDVWASQLKLAEQLLPPPIVQIASRIEQPFVSQVGSGTAPRAAYYDNKLFMIGDALAQVQPNTGLGTTLAAYAAYGLVDLIGDGSEIQPEKTKKWEEDVRGFAERASDVILLYKVEDV
ncbi:Hypothetical protein D9617_12g036880 [Elsinoe fawcettii]|nr:Hypothetical protein D9617_12g036880 [Elsinoe fawcettii]